MNLLDTLSMFFVISGALVFFIGGIGLLRFPDVYCRTSSISMSAGLGISLLFLAALFQDFTILNLIKVILAIHIQFIAAAIGGIAIDRAAYLNNVPLTSLTKFDELAEDSKTQN